MRKNIALILLAGLTAGSLFAGERAVYECTLQRALSGGRDITLLFGVEDGKTGPLGLRIPDAPTTDYRVKEHHLKMDGGRLSGPLQVQIGTALERLELDVTLDKGGTHTVAYGCRKAEGDVSVARPADGAGKQWVVLLRDAMGPDSPLALLLDIDRPAKTVQAHPAVAERYNKGKHPVDASKLAFDGTNLVGDLRITIVPDAWVPADKQPVDGVIKLRASLDGKNQAGTYAATFGTEKQRQGQVTVKRTTEAQLREATAPILAPDAPWRVFLVCSQQDRDRRKAPTYTPSPPASWAQADFDDSEWGRYSAELFTLFGAYGFGQSPANTLLCLRTRFGIADPAQVRDLTLTLEYRGGVVVYVNGREVARQHLPQGALEARTPAEAYPAEAFAGPDGTELPSSDRPAKEHGARYEGRIRRLSVLLPADTLRRGANTLALELHRAPTGSMPLEGRAAWATLGLCDAKLLSESGAGVAAYADALKTVTVTNATPLDMLSVTPGKKQAVGRWGTETTPQVALSRGNPFEPLRPIRAVAPRGGTCSGQVVVSGPEVLSGLHTTMSPLVHVRSGVAFPAEAVQVRYAGQARDEVYCNALYTQPVDGTVVQPVWVLVDVPRDQAPGWYVGMLTLTVGAQTTRVPVQILVAGWTVTDPKDNATLVSLYQSPDTLVQYYKVAPWSDRHFALIEKSMASMAKAGNDVLMVPVILDNYLNHKAGLIRWVRKGGGAEPEFSAFERYLDLHTKVFGKPKIVTLSVWKHDFGTRTWFRGMRSDVVKPCLVTELDPATGAMKPLQAPHFGEPGSEEFWQTMIEGVRRILKARGCDDRFLLLGEPFDSRPLQPVVDFFKKIEPAMRWQIYSHFDGGEPPPKNGKFISHGGFEVGFRINPNGSVLPEFSREYPKVAPKEYYEAQVQRWFYLRNSSLLSYRVVMRTGTLARVGLDFWPLTDERGQRNTLYSCPPNESWLWRGQVPDLTAPGPDGAVITTRGQMLLEGLQECEAAVVLIRALPKATPELAARIEQCLAARRLLDQCGAILSQALISLDWPGMAARDYALAAELAGTPGEGDWYAPPPAPEQARRPRL